jgi:hypothetical protein
VPGFDASMEVGVWVMRGVEAGGRVKESVVKVSEASEAQHGGGRA